jgi:hypothetical protein
MKTLLHVSMCLLLLSGVLVADEGMWLQRFSGRQGQDDLWVRADAGVA